MLQHPYLALIWMKILKEQKESLDLWWNGILWYVWWLVFEKKIHVCSEFWIFLSKPWSNRLIAPMDHSVKLQNIFWPFSKPISSMYFLTCFHQSWVWWPTTCLKMLLKMVQNRSMGPYVWCFWIIFLPWDARNTICLALIGYFSQNMD